MPPDNIETVCDTAIQAEIETLGPSALFSFEGRINRGTFWKITVLNAVFAIITGILGSRGFNDKVFNANAVTIALGILLGGITMWQSTATQVKRWHDLGKSGWMALLNVIPGVNAIAFLYLGFKEGTDGPNEYSEVPHDISLL